MTIAEIIIWTIIGIQGLAILILVREVADLRVLASSHNPAISRVMRVGMLAPEFEAMNLATKSVVGSAEWRGANVLILFVSPNCFLCRRLLAELAATTRDLTNLVIYCNGDGAECERHLLPVAAKATILRQEAMDVAEMFGVREFPVSMMLDDQWRIVEMKTPMSLDEIATIGSPGSAPQLDAA